MNNVVVCEVTENRVARLKPQHSLDHAWHCGNMGDLNSLYILCRVGRQTDALSRTDHALFLWVLVISRRC